MNITIKRLLCIVLVFVFIATIAPIRAESASYTNSKDLHKAHENKSDGSPLYNGQTITVEGIVTVPTGVWHDNANYFSIVTEKDTYRFAGGIAVYLPGIKTPDLNIGDKVIVTGTVSNTGYSIDSGTTVIIPSGADDIELIGSGFEIPDAYPIVTDPSYEQVELDKGYRFEGI